ncbi:MAG: hypothetical protein GY950_13445 [bacterium]|nr:hypothetical protein [bacterium]
MDEKEILSRLERVSKKLEKVGDNINKNDWDGVEKLMAQVDNIQKKIINNPVKVESLMAQSPSFEKEYSSVKAKLLEQLGKNNPAIEERKVTHTEKIAGSKNVLDNMAKYYKPKNTSYYIDKKE